MRDRGNPTVGPSALRCQNWQKSHRKALSITASQRPSSPNILSAHSTAVTKWLSQALRREVPNPAKPQRPLHIVQGGIQNGDKALLELLAHNGCHKRPNHGSFPGRSFQKMKSSSTSSRPRSFRHALRVRSQARPRTVIGRTDMARTRFNPAYRAARLVGRDPTPCAEFRMGEISSQHHDYTAGDSRRDPRPHHRAQEGRD